MLVPNRTSWLTARDSIDQKLAKSFKTDRIYMVKLWNGRSNSWRMTYKQGFFANYQFLLFMALTDVEPSTRYCQFLGQLRSNSVQLLITVVFNIAATPPLFDGSRCYLTLECKYHNLDSVEASWWSSIDITVSTGGLCQWCTRRIVIILIKKPCDWLSVSCKILCQWCTKNNVYLTPLCIKIPKIALS